MNLYNYSSSWYKILRRSLVSMGIDPTNYTDKQVWVMTIPWYEEDVFFLRKALGFPNKEKALGCYEYQLKAKKVNENDIKILLKKAGKNFKKIRKNFKKSNQKIY